MPTTNLLMGDLVTTAILFSCPHYPEGTGNDDMAGPRRSSSSSKRIRSATCCMAWHASREPWKVRCSQQGTPHRPPGCIAQPETYPHVDAESIGTCSSSSKGPRHDRRRQTPWPTGTKYRSLSVSPPSRLSIWLCSIILCTVCIVAPFVFILYAP